MQADAPAASDWVQYRPAGAAGVTLMQAHFTDHAFERHSHPEYGIGLTGSGVQTFNCRGTTQTSVPGDVILLNPDQAHDGLPGQAGGYGYCMLYLEAEVLPGILQRAAGIQGSRHFRAPVVHDPQAAATLQAYSASKQAAASTENREKGNAFLAQNKTQKGVVTTPSGLQYMVLRQGSGERPMPTSKVRVNYEGKLLNGEVFDSSYKTGQPAEFSLSQVVPGWSEGVALMPVGSKYRFWIPSNLGYGPQGTPGGPIGPDSMLTFDVELLGILQ
jgi:FKBP-type peptidyl-prolyl cis-trans isomerase